MKKFYIVFAALVVLFFCTGRLLAANSDFKNNLLKIELTKTDDTHYNIGLYTQKTYNEPVKIIKKTDTIYYFLLPETSHSITSVQPVGDIKNVLVKSYPYAGQDLDNAYTKVAIITSKPLNLTTSLKTADSSVSPRLNPLRLAKLDQVFENYAQRLANNNVPTPLSEFRKMDSTAKTDTQKIASASTQAKQTAGITAKTASTPVSTTAKSSAKSTNTITSTPSKTTQAQNSASTAAKTQTATSASKDSAVKAAAKSNAVTNTAKTSTPAASKTTVAAQTQASPAKTQASTAAASTKTQTAPAKTEPSTIASSNAVETSSNLNKSNLLADNSNAVQKNSQVIEAAKKSAVTSSVPAAGTAQNISLNNSSSTKTQASTAAASTKTQASAITSSKTSTAKSVNEAVKNSAITSSKGVSAAAKPSAKSTNTITSTPSKTTQAQNSASTAAKTQTATSASKDSAVKAAAKSNAVTNTAKTSTPAASKTTVAAQTQASPAKTQASTAAASTKTQTSAITSSKTSTAKSVNEAVKNSAITPLSGKQQNAKAMVPNAAKTVSPALTQVKPLDAEKSEKTSALLNTDTVQNAITAKSQDAVKSADKLNTAEKQVIEYEKQLADKNPVNAEFAQKTTPLKEEITPSPGKVQEQNQKVSKQKNSKPVSNIPQKNNGNANLLVLSSLFLVMFYSYVKVKKANERKKNLQAEAIAAQNTKSEGVKDLLKKKAKQPAQVLQNAAQTSSAPVYSAPAEQSNILEETINEQVQEEAPVSKPETIRPALRYLDETDYTPISSDVISQYDMQEFEPLTRLRQEQMQKAREEYEKAQAFNAYMDSIAEKTEDKPVSLSSEVPQTEDDAVLQELYTPIEPDYTEEDVVARYNNEPAEPAEESATIVSSSKLTETRGLYLAQFEGATSLVGYIQDDVYVLYNFGELKTEDLDIQSRLAQENDTDSLYIVKTGGKKLMVKSTPYDMRLEMVM